MEHPFFSKKDRRKFEDHERSLAKTFHGRCTPGSGATPLVRHKGDVQTDRFVIEAKCTGKKSYVLHYDTLCTVQNIALQCNKVPVLALRFDFEPCHPLEQREWVILSKKDFEDMLLCC